MIYIVQIRAGDEATVRQRRAHRVAAVRAARVVAATLIGAGGDLRDLLEPGQLFDVVVIDEVMEHSTGLASCAQLRALETQSEKYMRSSGSCSMAEALL